MRVKEVEPRKRSLDIIIKPFQEQYLAVECCHPEVPQVCGVLMKPTYMGTESPPIPPPPLEG